MLKLSVTILCICLCINCVSRTDANNNVPLKTKQILFSKWDQIFENHEIIAFTFDDPEREIYRFGSMVISPNGDYFIIDGKAKKILHFDSSGKFKQSIGGFGEGPGEFTIPGCPVLDKNNNLYVYDAGKLRINKYEAGEYKFTNHFQIPTYIQDLIFDNKEDFIVYTASEPNILFKINHRGEVINKILKGDQDSFRLFSSRFELGRISALPNDSFLLTYPEEYKIYLFDYEFNLKKVFYADSKSKFFPAKAVFPNTLSPYRYSPKHSKWWGQSLRPARIFYLENGVFVVDIVKFTNISSKLYVNIHDLDGNTYAAGMEIPFDGIIKYAKDGYIYIVEDSKLQENDKIIPLKLHRFKLKANLLKQNSN